VGAVFKRGIDAALLEVHKYKYDKKWDDPTTEECMNGTNINWFYNITNYNAFVGGAKPILEVVGPYNWTIQICKFNVSVDGKIESYQRYKKRPHLVNDEDGKSLEDIIYALNPGYLAVMYGYESAGIPQPELCFESDILAGTIGAVIEST
jgi:hypothetical protein